MYGSLVRGLATRGSRAALLAGSLELFQKCLKMEKDIPAIDTCSMCCLHSKAYVGILFFCGSRLFCRCFWSNMALLTLWVADPCPSPSVYPPRSKWLPDLNLGQVSGDEGNWPHYYYCYYYYYYYYYYY